MRHSMFMVEEYIQNKDKALTNSKSTTVNLNKGGDWFFLAHIQDKERYARLVVDYTGFIDRIVAKTKQLGKT